MSKMKFASALLLSVVALDACAPVIAAGAVGGATGAAASREGGIGQAFTDTQISAKLHDTWFRTDREMFDKLYVTVFEGRVLITGSVQKPEQRDNAIRLAWQIPSVRQVINEIRVEPSEGVSGYTKDAWIGTQFRTRLLSDGDVQSRNYKFECNKGTIYLIGVARDQEELTRVINHARNISYVQDVVSYVRSRSDTRPNEGQSATIQNAPPANYQSSTAPAVPTYEPTSSGPIVAPQGNSISSTELEPVR